MPTRVIAPLVLPSAKPGFDGKHPRIAPILTVLGRGYILNPFDIATIAVTRLGDAVGSFSSNEEARRAIQDALDAVLKPF
jgi:hypothetical protein